MSPLTEDDDKENYGEILDGLGDVLKDVVDSTNEKKADDELIEEEE